MTRARTAVASVVLALVGSVALPVSSSAQPAVPPAGAATAGDLATLQARLTALTAQAQSLAGQLEAAAARDGGLRQAMDDLAGQEDASRAQFDQRVRRSYMLAVPHPLDPLLAVARPGDQLLQARGTAAALGVDRDLVTAVGTESERARALKAGSERFRAGLRVQAQQVLAAQDEARGLLATAERLAQTARDTARAAQATAQLAAARVRLDAVSATVTLALTPAQTDRSRGAQRDEVPLLALVDAAGTGYPQGYRPSGVVLAGGASWYGPGFVGNPTASGSPYDPERLTCAHKTLPLGTLLHVTSNGLAINCLVNDRGPYVGDRILDMSRAGSRALGYSGVAQVSIEVLTRVG